MYGVTEEKDLTREVLGGKGYSLVQMARKGLRVPKAVILPCPYGAMYLGHPDVAVDHARMFIDLADTFIKPTKAKDPKPLVSVRSGARVSMAGMMDTMLNVGISPDNQKAYAKLLGEECAIDCVKRLTKMILTLGFDVSDDLISEDSEQNIEKLKGLFMGTYPDRKEQLILATKAVFESWNNDRAKYYREKNNIPNDWGTAVIIQQMVFGNKNENSCTGVLFTRNPDNGDLDLVGEYLNNAQGEDVVSGSVTPKNITELAKESPELYTELHDTVMALEADWGDVLDVEFTIEDGVLYFLQCRSAKKSAVGAMRLSIGMFLKEKLPIEACLRMVEPKHLDLVVQDRVLIESSHNPYSEGIPACSGVVTGTICFNIEKIKNVKALGGKAIFLAEETTPDDIEAMDLADGVLTYKGGATSHAAVVARSMNKPCVVGIKSKSCLTIEYGKEYTFCGSTGLIWEGVPMIQNGNTDLLDEWLDVYATALNVKIVDRLPPHRLADMQEDRSLFSVSQTPEYAMAESIFGDMAIPDHISEIKDGWVEGAANIESFDNLNEFSLYEGKAKYTGKVTQTQKVLYEAVVKLREKLWGEVLDSTTDLVFTKSHFLGVLLQPV